jgi:hypothetical protein
VLQAVPIFRRFEIVIAYISRTSQFSPLSFGIEFANANFDILAYIMCLS